MTTDYSAIAEEYYDNQRHPTCANFRYLSKHLIEKILRESPVSPEIAADIGAGDSLLAELRNEQKFFCESLLVIDSSIEMLKWSQKWAGDNFWMLIALAEGLPIASGSINCLIVSLGDSFNTGRFWVEANRVLAKGGRVIFTTPSFDWAKAYRDSEAIADPSLAVFDTQLRGNVAVPSYIYPDLSLVQMAEEAGLCVRRVVHGSIEDLSGSVTISRKITGATDSGTPIVTALDASRE